MAELKIDLTHRLVVVEEKVATGLLIDEINIQAADIENEKANVEAEKAGIASAEAAVMRNKPKKSYLRRSQRWKRLLPLLTASVKPCFRN